ncbi:probable U2 small nuclear ribonucleoprotein A' [Bombus vosnesenskii]|uniref:Probable U2 small nuclear ribonucleoprotein A' n=4 Tax=Bombus TaxID=28641 RepID=A0A6J3L2G4_9HYME|nr:probable U2 small nuclear ribonucleoprotein A' [Bombus terrestris]XP_003490993.1 probable U2 small nuclear ribonucleoprotein A' [Bombus impatiens]XP_033194660.1 probable U2 small nuclear ribonucleoprotein A' [Bombus vancouverensis nearcticus]XP_033305119.1 probable U2 small nuclear ribonucleoprotein A' [Bombus bifarius]XP_033359455.1 probable U2 small nuclear ribonucleoprotein A' [Bombus vosnesenskii]XP_050485621.1 probable U2 small nuclear ribonucleoprotein A' [Bombus huntii]XP_050589187.
MVKLTPDLIQQSMQYINPVKDRELDLRGYKIPTIENLGATLDQFDTIDFSDNDIRKLDGFPLLKRIKTLFFNNNRIVRIGEGLEHCIPNLETLMLTGNMIQELGDLEPLTQLKNLTNLCLLQNPVSAKPQYRQYVVYRFPQLRLLDFRKIKMKEREAAVTYFRSKRGKEMVREIAKKVKTQTSGIPTDKPLTTPEERNKIREAITNTSSLEEVQRLSKLLQAGHVPSEERLQTGNTIPEAMEEEDD